MTTVDIWLQTEDVLRIAAESDGAAYDELEAAQLLWVDRLGMYLYIQVRPIQRMIPPSIPLSACGSCYAWADAACTSTFKCNPFSA